MSIKEVTDASFVEDTKEGLVVAELGAAWCAPCKMILPILEEINQEEDNQINVVQLDIDKNPETAQKYGVMSIPTLLFFKDGELVDKSVGFQEKDAILSIAHKHA